MRKFLSGIFKAVRKFSLALILVMIIVSASFGDATSDLFEAVRYENTTPERIYELIIFGAKINAKNQDGYTALMRAASVNTNPEIIRALIISEADVNAKDIRGYTALSRAVLNYSQSPEIVRMLIDAGADVNAKTKSGSTILFQAAHDASNPNPEVIRILLEAGADISTKILGGKTVLDYNLNDNIRKVIEEFITQRTGE